MPGIAEKNVSSKDDNANYDGDAKARRHTRQNEMVNVLKCFACLDAAVEQPTERDHMHMNMNMHIDNQIREHKYNHEHMHVLENCLCKRNLTS